MDVHSTVLSLTLKTTHHPRSKADGRREGGAAAALQQGHGRDGLCMVLEPAKVYASSMGIMGSIVKKCIGFEGPIEQPTLK